MRTLGRMPAAGRTQHWFYASKPWPPSSQIPGGGVLPEAITTLCGSGTRHSGPIGEVSTFTELMIPVRCRQNSRDTPTHAFLSVSHLLYTPDGVVGLGPW